MTDLRASIECVKHHEKELRLFNVDPTDAIHEALRTQFAMLNVRITVGQTASKAPEDVAVLSNRRVVLAVVDGSTLRELLGDVPTKAGRLGVTNGKYRTILRHLKETTFTSYDTEQLLYGSREIEDRARRIGQGSIHAGFQRCSAMTDQRSVYADLASQGVSVHAYGIPDATPPDLGSGHVHAVPADEIAETWFVVFDGGGDETQKTALLACERADNEFYGVLTYDPGFVDPLLAYLDRTYDTSTDGVEPDL
ncbi:DICT sensory domain-containing protein [Haloplanus sp.]|uniref:DICT sensory domain-containing protein n=1 Tax=Haloplanus sp. TaxID=1961696 RepID=UPI002602D6CD|nr:DICT sensory domain-containing protein [Haloplanus sp.]